MTEQSQAPSPKTPEEFLKELREKIPPFDPTLESLVGLINLLDATEIGITLHIGGAVVSGMLVSATQYWRLLQDELTDPSRFNKPENVSAGEYFADFFRPTLESMERELVEYRTNGTMPQRPVHIHLRHAVTYISSSDPLGGILWRGRLTEVDGWSLNSYGVFPPPPQLDRADEPTDEART